MEIRVLCKAGLVAGALASVTAAGVRPVRESRPLQGSVAVAHLKEQRLYASLGEAFTAARYQVQRAGKPCTGYTAQNPAHGFRTRFERGGMTLAYASQEARGQGGREPGSRELRSSQPLRKTGVRTLNARTPERLNAAAPNTHYALRNTHVRLTAIGRGGHLASVSPISLRTQNNRVDYTHRTAAGTSVREWYVNDPTGLEHGFVLPEVPGADTATQPHTHTPTPAQPLTLELALDTELRPDPSPNGRRLTLRNEQGEAVLAYEKLKVWDATGRVLPAQMQLVAEAAFEPGGSKYALRTTQYETSASRNTPPYTLNLLVNDEDAAYPLTIDPTWTQQQKLTAGDGAANDYFGYAVAVSGDTALIGSPYDNVGANNEQGSAYVFTRSGTTWTQEQQLTASDGTVNDFFGLVVALNGDTALVGAYGDDVGANPDQGSAYVFTRSGTTWTQQQKLTAGDGGVFDEFGRAVAVENDTAVIGAHFDDVGANGDQGSAYVFTRSGTTWTQQQKLTASDGAATDQFGVSVTVSGETAVVGAMQHNVGANGDQGAAYVFTRSGTTWTQEQKLTADDGAANDFFGQYMALDSDTVVVTSYADDSGANSNLGSAYVFTRSGTTWTQQQKLTPSDGVAAGEFGRGVALDGDTAMVGAPITSAGSVYLYTRSGTTWTQQQKLTASDGGAGDRLGWSVALDGTTVVAGAFFDDVGANGDQGSAYVFTTTVDPPVISNVQVTSIGQTTATITWTTDVASSSTVEYRTVGAGSYSTATGAAGTSHSVSLTGLTAGRTYEYRVRSITTGGSAPSAETINPAAGHLQVLTAPNLAGEVLGISLRRLAGTIYATVTYYNASGASQSSVEVVSAELAGTSTVNTTTGTPVSLGTVANGGSASTTLEFSGGAGASGSSAIITVGYSSASGGSTSSSYRVTLP